MGDRQRASRAPEDAELSDALERLNNPDATTIASVADVAEVEFSEWVKDRKNRRVVGHRFEAIGYVPVRNPTAEDGLWKIHGKRQAVYAKQALDPRDRPRRRADFYGISPVIHTTNAAGQ